MKTRRALIGSGIFAFALLITAVTWALLPWLYPPELMILRETNPTSLLSPGVLVSDFNDFDAWKYDASHGLEDGGGIAQDEHSFEGLAVKLTTSRVPNSSAWMTLTGLKLDISDAGTFSFWVNIPDVHRIESIALYVATDETFTRYFASSIDVRGVVAPGPQMMAISIKELQANGGMTVQDLATTVQLRITSEIGDGSASFDHLYYGRRATPKIIVTFDDNWLTQFTEAFPYMLRKGVPGTIYAIQESIGLDRYMSLPQLQEVYAAGWDVGNHTTDHMGFNRESTRVPLLWGRKLLTIANPQEPKTRLALNGGLSENGRAILKPPRIAVFWLEHDVENPEAVRATVVGADRVGQPVIETVPLAQTGWMTTNNEFSEVREITFASPPKAQITVGIAQAGDTTVSSIMGCTNYLISNGMPRAAYHVAYPNGERNFVTDRAMAELRMKTGRIVSGRTTPVADGLVNPHTVQALAPNMNTPLKEVMHMVDMAIEHGATTFVVFHRLERTLQVPTDYSIADFHSFIDYVVQKRDEGLIEPMTVSAWYESLPAKKGVAAPQRKPRIERLRSNIEGPDDDAQLP
jgi:peptidoglycan/xylan/chitin deacetylase (PgdA/CDA1 family)